jgi:hypothetical protein
LVSFTNGDNYLFTNVLSEREGERVKSERNEKQINKVTPLVQRPGKKIAYDRGPFVGLQNSLPVAQGKMKMTGKRSPISSLDQPGRWRGGGYQGAKENPASGD